MEPRLVAALVACCFLLLILQGLRMLVDIQTRMTVIGRVEQKLDLLLQHAGIKFDPFANVPPDVVDALRQGQKIKAIKLYRQKTGGSLKDAKDFVEALQRGAGLT
jgi:hypothetical protein